MPDNHLTPGVFVTETNPAPEPIEPVSTTVAAFLGFTQKADRDGTSLTNVPVRIGSLLDYEHVFGGPPNTRFNVQPQPSGNTSCTADPATQFFLYHSLKLFFSNGGTACWIVSVGSYGHAHHPVVKQATDFDEALVKIALEPEPALLAIPDAVLLDATEWASLSNRAIEHCASLNNRFAILDVFEGYTPRTLGSDDVISGDQGFRTVIEGDNLSYGAAYYPWLNASVVSSSTLNFTHLNEASRMRLHDKVLAELSADSDDVDALRDLVVNVLNTQLSPQRIGEIHQTLASLSPHYQNVMENVLHAHNILPPSGAVAGLISRVDTRRGVFKAPAGESLNSVVGLTVSVNDAKQEDLNVSPTGKSINAIRSFTGKGVVVWGARTLDGNSNEWRYVNVRRTISMFEQSIRNGLKNFIFEDNVHITWSTIKNSLSHFFSQQFRSGALAGTKPEEAFFVNVGLNETMTQADIDNGRLIITVGFAPVRPAEFITLSIELQMQPGS